MIDIHCHPLPEIDDGAASFEIAVEMLEMAAKDGITHVVATPHCNFRYAFDPEENEQKRAQLQKAVGNTPQLLLGCDLHLSYDNIRRLTDNHGPFTVNGTQYVLVELDEHFIPEQMDNVFYEIQMAGFTPILTHPERNAICRRKFQSMYNWVTRGCLVQVTAQSYTGHFGSEAHSAAKQLLNLNLVHIVASDAHDTRYRPPLLSGAYRRIAATRGKQIADLLFEQNPGAVINGRPLPPQPQPVSPNEKKGKKSWLPFLKR